MQRSYKQKEKEKHYILKNETFAEVVDNETSLLFPVEPDSIIQTDSTEVTEQNG